VLPICSTNKYRVSGPTDFYVGSTTPIGAIGTIAPQLLVVWYNSTNWSAAATKLQHHTYSIDNTYSLSSSGA
jgi:hypothetical protein